jgi:hypothetical protein
MLMGHLYAEARGGWERLGEAAMQLGSGGTRKGKKLTSVSHMSARGEREGKLAKGVTRRRKSIPKNAPKALGAVGPGERQRPTGRGGPTWAELGWPGQIPSEDSNEKNDF